MVIRAPISRVSGARSRRCPIGTLRFQDEDDYEDEIFQYYSSARAPTSVISAEKRDSRRHSTTSFSENVEKLESEVKS